MAFDPTFDFDFPPLDDLIDIPLAPDDFSPIHPFFDLRPPCPVFSDVSYASSPSSHDPPPLRPSFTSPSPSPSSSSAAASDGSQGVGGTQGSTENWSGEVASTRWKAESKGNVGRKAGGGGGEGGMRRRKKRKGGAAAEGRRACVHCGVTSTPQWREGPAGPKTLCNACGVRYKSGRLLPEYRPAASPTFLLGIHSNSHRRVLEIHSRRNLLPSLSC